MIWCYVLYAAVLGGTPLSLIKNVSLRTLIQRYYLTILVIALILFVILRLAGPSRDFESYIIWFNTIISGEATPALKLKDPAFFIISCVSGWIGLDFLGVLLVFTVITVNTQLYFARLTSNAQYLTLYFYLIFCRLFILQDYTQIRAALAVVLMSLSIILASKSRKASSLGIYVLSLVFHLSAILSLPLMIMALAGSKLRSRAWIFLLVPGVIAVKLGQARISAIASGFSRIAIFIHDKDFYRYREDPHVVNYFAFSFLIRVAFLLIVTFFYWEKLPRQDRFAVLGASMGLFYYVAFSSFAEGVSVRSSELFALLELLVFMIPFNYMKRNWRILYAVASIILAFVYYHTTLLLLPSFNAN